MTLNPLELVGLPDGGPTSVGEVKAYLGIIDARDDDALEQIVAAVNAQVRSWRCAQAAVDADEWPAGIKLGATMLASRWLRRRDTPGGVEAFGSDVAVYVQRSDPDVAQLLGLGAYQPPVVG